MLKNVEQKSFKQKIMKTQELEHAKAISCSQELDQVKVISCYSQKLKVLLVVGSPSTLFEYKVRDMQVNQLNKKEFYETNSALVTIKLVYAQNISEMTYIYIGLSTG
jgi:hypothetical protein